MIFPTQGLKLDLLNCRQTLYHLSYSKVSVLIPLGLLEFPNLPVPTEKSFAFQNLLDCLSLFFEKWKKVKVVSDSLQPHGLYSPWNSPDQNTEVDSLSLLQGIFSTQELNWGLLHCRQVFYQLSYQGMGCKTGKGACSPPSSSLRRVPLSCSETPKTWITIWRQIFLTHAQRNMLYLENTYFINLIIFMPDFWLNPLP